MIFNPVYMVRPKGKAVNFVDYIASSGTQYIDTEFVPDTNSKAEVAFSCAQTEGAAICGTENGWKNNGFSIYSHTVEYGTDVKALTVSNQKRSIVLDKGAVYENGDLIATLSGTVNCNYSLLAFARNRGGAIGEHSTTKLYSLKLYDNGYLVRDYQPCLDENGVACLYEKINQKYVYNAGTGEFTSPK